MGKLVFSPEKLPQDHKFSFAHPFEERWIEVDSHNVHSLYFKAANPKGLILYFHGSGGSLKSWGYASMGLAGRFQYDVWIVDYPGYGKSEGTLATEQELFRLAEKMWQSARLQFAPEKILVYGVSLGSGLAVYLASEHAVGGVVLEAPFLSLSSMVQKRVFYFPEVFIPFPMRSDLRIGKIAAPMLIVHGERDDVIPVAQGEALSRLAPHSRFVKVPDAFHNDLSDFEAYNEAVSTWMREREEL